MLKWGRGVYYLNNDRRVEWGKIQYKYYQNVKVGEGGVYYLSNDRRVEWGKIQYKYYLNVKVGEGDILPQ